MDAIDRATGVRLGKRQVEALATAAAADFDAFYAQTGHPKPATAIRRRADEQALVLSYDGKGVVMRPDALRPATAKAAADGDPEARHPAVQGRETQPQTHGRGRRRLRRRPAPRAPPATSWPAPDDHAADHRDRSRHGQVADRQRHRRRRHRRSPPCSTRPNAATPTTPRTWVVLVDGNNHQIDRIQAEADARGLDVAIVIDFIHVLEYLWDAAWCFFAEGDPAAEDWVRDQALAVLDGKADHRRRRHPPPRHRRRTARRPAPQAPTTAADYLINKAPYLDYPTALASGWPIATGVIEGACRHLVKDRMDITGARWGLAGAEAVLKLRALRSNGDFDDYWRYHLTQERRRVHQAQLPQRRNSNSRMISPHRHSGIPTAAEDHFRRAAPRLSSGFSCRK